jgi:outer membrane protein TolC
VPHVSVVRVWLLALGFTLVLGRAKTASADELAIPLARALAIGAQRGPVVIEAQRVRASAQDFARDPGSSLPSPPQATVLAGAREPRGLPVGPEIVLSAQQEFAVRGLGRARTRAAELALRAATDDVARARLEGALTAALAWIELLEAQELLRVRTAALRDTERLESLAERRVASGTAIPTERALARAEVGSARVALLDGEGRVIEARLTLALALGEPLETLLRAEGDADAIELRRVDLQSLMARARQHPALRAARAHASYGLAEVDVVRATAGPTFSIGATAWREASGDRAAAAIFSVPLPFFDPARFERARQASAATTLAARADRLEGELERALRVAIHDREHTREVRAEVRERVVEPLRATLESSLAAYSAGTSDLGSVLLTRRSLYAAEERLATATADVSRADAQLAAFAGTLIPEEP